MILSITRDWRVTSRIYAITIFAMNSYMFMHVLQVREYALGILFLLCVMKLTLMLVDYDGRESVPKFPWLYIFYGTTVGLAKAHPVVPGRSISRAGGWSPKRGWVRLFREVLIGLPACRSLSCGAAVRAGLSARLCGDCRGR